MPDWWEEKWGYNKSVWDDHANLDPDNDALNNIEECYTDKWDSNPFIKDIFIEVDWFESSVGEIDSNKPTEKYINKLENVFSDHEINIHIDNGCMGGGEQLEDISEFYYWELRDIYWDNFLHNDLNNPRKGIFHYCFVTDYGPYPGFGGFAFFGWDHLDSWEIAGQRVDENHPLKNKQHVILSIIMHELGHNMGLLSDDCGGNDNLPATKTFSRQWFKYFPYQSIMNYMFTYWILDYSDGSRGKNDYDDWSNLEFDFFKDSHFEWPKD